MVTITIYCILNVFSADLNAVKYRKTADFEKNQKNFKKSVDKREWLW